MIRSPVRSRNELQPAPLPRHVALTLKLSIRKRSASQNAAPMTAEAPVTMQTPSRRKQRRRRTNPRRARLIRTFETMGRANCEL